MHATDKWNDHIELPVYFSFSALSKSLLNHTQTAAILREDGGACIFSKVRVLVPNRLKPKMFTIRGLLLEYNR